MNKDEALKIALRQWRHYAEERPNECLETETHEEAKLYQECLKALHPTKRKDEK